MARRTRGIWQAVAATVAVGVVGGTIVAFAMISICDEQLTNDGRVVPVCRHMQATDPPVLAAGLVLLVALGTFFTEISGFGISLKREFQEVRRTAEEAHDQAAEARSVTQTFEETASDLAEGVQQALTRSQPEQARPTNGSQQSELAILAEEYNNLRWTMPGGRERTALMTELVQKMVGQARRTSTFDVDGYLHTNNAGRRLAAYVYLYAHRDPSRASALAEAMLRDDKPFNQYWALRALEAQQVSLSATLDRDLLGRLRDRLPKLESDASRYRLLSELLQT